MNDREQDLPFEPTGLAVLRGLPVLTFVGDNITSR